MTGGGDDTTQPVPSATYTLDADADAPPARRPSPPRTAPARTATDTFTITKPTDRADRPDGRARGGPWYTTASVPLTLDTAPTPAPASTPPPRSSSATSATLSDGTCGRSAPGRRSRSSAAPTRPSPPATATATAYTVSDNVGNLQPDLGASADREGRHDRAERADARRSPSRSPRTRSSTGTTLYYNPQGSNSGTFTVTRDGTDAPVRRHDVGFPNVFGTTGGGDRLVEPVLGTTTPGAPATPPAARRPSPSRTAPAPTATGTFTVTPDTTAPTGQSVDLPAARGTTSRVRPADARHGTDAGSGLDASTQRRRARPTTLTSGTCGTFRLLAHGHARRRRRHDRHQRQLLPLPHTASPTTSATERALGRVRDREGRHAARRPSRLDAPTAVTGAAPVLRRRHDTLYYRPSGSGSFTLNATASDAESGIDHVTFPTLSGDRPAGRARPAAPTRRARTARTTTPGRRTRPALGATTVTPRTARRRQPATRSRSSPTRPRRPASAPTLAGGPWYTTASVPLTLDNGTDARLRPRHHQRRRRARRPRRSPDGTCGTFGVLVDGHAHRRRRHDRRDRQLLPLPLHDLRQRRQRDRRRRRPPPTRRSTRARRALRR